MMHDHNGKYWHYLATTITTLTLLGVVFSFYILPNLVAPVVRKAGSSFDIAQYAKMGILPTAIWLAVTLGFWARKHWAYWIPRFSAFCTGVLGTLFFLAERHAEALGVAVLSAFYLLALFKSEEYIEEED